MAASPTPERLRRALREGDSPISALVVRAAALTAAVLLGPGAATAMTAWFRERLGAALSQGRADALRIPADVVTLAGPMVLAAAAIAAIAGLAQTGGVLALRGRGRARGAAPVLVDGRRAYEALRGAALALVIPAVTLWLLASTAPSFAAAIGRPEEALLLAGGVVRRLLLVLLAVLGVAAAIDATAQRVAWKRRWALSPGETRRERRDDEGDANVKAARLRAHEELVRRDG